MRGMIVLCVAAAVVAVVGMAGEPCGELLANGSFEEGLGGWAVPSWRNDLVRPEIDHAVVQGPGGASLRMKGAAGREGAVCQRVRLPAVKKRLALSGWIKTAGYAGNWSARISLGYVSPTDGKTRDVALVTSWQLKELDWQEFRQELDIPDDVVDATVYLSTARPTATAADNLGTTWFDNVSLRVVGANSPVPPVPDNGPKLISAVPGGASGLYLPGEAVSMSVKIANLVAAERKVGLNWEIVDFNGQPTVSGETPLTLPPKSNEVFELKLPGQDKLGFFAVRLKLPGGDGKFDEAVASFCVLEPPPAKADPFFGLCAAYLAGKYDEAVRRMGVGTTPVGASRIMEKNPGVYDFSGMDKELAHHVRQDVSPVGHLVVIGMPHYTHPPWLRQQVETALKAGKNPFDAEYYAAYRRYAAALFQHVGQRINDWSVVGEIDLMRHGSPLEEEHYVNCVKILSEELKRLYPAHTIGGVGVSGVDCQANLVYAKQLWARLKDHLDGVCLDAYVSPNIFGPGREAVGEERGGLRGILSDAAKMVGDNKYVTVEEKGYRIVSSLPVDSPHVKKMAATLARGLIVAKSSPRMRRYLHFLVDDVWKEGKEDYGLWRQGSPRPAAAAYAVVARFFAGASEPVEVKPLQDVYGYVFSRSGKSVVGLWALSDDPVNAALALPGAWRGCDMMGNPLSGPAGQQTLKLSSQPLFLEVDAPPRAVAEALGKGSYDMPKLDAALLVKDLRTLAVHVQNRTNAPLPVTVKFDGLDGGKPVERAVTLPAGDVAAVELPLGAASYLGLNGKTAKVEARAGGVAYHFEKDLELYPVKRLASPPVLDGTLKSFADVKPLVLDNASWLFPVDAMANGLWKGKDDLSAKVCLAYDADNLYLAAEVTDDVNVTRSSGFGIWSQDAVQFAFDAGNDALGGRLARPGYGKDDWDYAMAATSGGPQVYCFTAAGDNPEFREKSLPFPVAVRRDDKANTTVYEVAVPWKALAPLRPVAGNVFGFNLAVFDPDEPQQPVMYWMGLTPGIAGGKNPAAFKRFILTE